MNKISKYILSLILKKKIRNEAGKNMLLQEEISYARVELLHFLRDAFFIFAGILSAAFGLKGFLLPNMFLDGGAMGISLIVAELTVLPLSVLIILINIPFLIMGRYSISRQFAFKSASAILLLALAVHYISFPTVTEDKLLIAVFGGFFLGLGIGLAVRGGAVIDGTEVLAVFVSRRTPMTIGDVILVFNIFIFGIAAYVFSVEISLYAMLTYLAASRTVDFVVSGIEEYVGVMIITEKHEEIKNAILENMGRGCTVFYGEKGHTSEKTHIIYTLITRLELAKLYTEIDKTDKKSFIVLHSIKDARGGMIKKRKLD